MADTLISMDVEYLVSVEVLAHITGLTERRIQQLETEGVIERVSHGRYSLFESTRGYCEFLRMADKHSSSEAEREERTRLTRAKRRQAELKLEEMAGRLVDREAMNKQDYEIARVLKLNLETIADRVAATLAAEETEDKCFRIVADQVAQCLDSVRAALADRQVTSNQVKADDPADDS